MFQVVLADFLPISFRIHLAPSKCFASTPQTTFFLFWFMGCYTLFVQDVCRDLWISSWHSSTSITGFVLLHQQNFLQSNPTFVLARVLHIKFAQPRTQRTNEATWMIIMISGSGDLEVPTSEKFLHHRIHINCILQISTQYWLESETQAMSRSNVSA